MNTTNYQHLLKDLEFAAKRSRPKLNPDQKLSLCMIARNEEAVIAAAIQSARSVADEIIVVDTGSTDRTVEIARENGAKVFFFEWQDDFAEARNQSLKHATGDWVLIMDADERIPDEVAANIRVLMIRTEQPISYLITIKNYMSQKDPSHIVNHQMVRLFRKTRDTFFFGPIHEQLFPHSGEVVIPSEVFYLEHWGYQHSNVKENKIEGRNIPLLRKAIEKTEKNNPALHSFYCFYMGSSVSDPVEGTQWLRKAIDNCPDITQASHIPVAYLDYLNCLLISKQYEEGIKIAEEAIRKLPNMANFPEFWDYYGMHLAMAGRPDDALPKLHKAMEVEQNTDDNKMFNILREERIGRWGTLINIGTVYRLKGDMTQAQQYFIKALEAYPKADKQPVINRIVIAAGSQLDFLQAYYENSFVLNPEAVTPEAIAQLSNLYLKQEKPALALTLQLHVFSLLKAWQSALALLQIYRQSHRGDLLQQTYTLLNTWDIPPALEWPERFAMLVPEETALPETLFFFNRLLQQSQLPLDSLKALVESALQAQWLPTAEQALQQLLSQQPDDYEAALRLALVEQNQQHLPKAIVRLNQLLETHSHRPEAYIQLANLYLAEGQFAEAERHLRQIPGDGSSYVDYALGMALMGQDKLAEAEQYLLKAKAKEPDNPSVQYLLHLLHQPL